jgi:DNA-binding NtrC family response regulator
MQNACRALIVSPNPRTWQKMSASLETSGMDVICCSTVAEAREVLEQEPLPLVFCEEWLRDGTYHDLLGAAKASDTHLVVVHGPGACEDAGFKSKALKQGAYAVIGSGADAVDIEWIATRTLHDGARFRAAVGA